MVSPTTASLRSATGSQQSLPRAQSLYYDYVPTSGQPRDTLGTPILARANWILGRNNSKFRKKLFVAILEYLFTTQIREGFSLKSKLSVVGWMEFDPGNNKNLSWISQNALGRLGPKPEVLNTLSLLYEHLICCGRPRTARCSE